MTFNHKNTLPKTMWGPEMSTPSMFIMHSITMLEKQITTCLHCHGNIFGRNSWRKMMKMLVLQPVVDAVPRYCNFSKGWSDPRCFVSTSYGASWVTSMSKMTLENHHQPTQAVIGRSRVWFWCLLETIFIWRRIWHQTLIFIKHLLSWILYRQFSRYHKRNATMKLIQTLKVSLTLIRWQRFDLDILVFIVLYCLLWDIIFVAV